MQSILNSIESNLTELAATVGPWLAPLPSAFLVWRACVNHLSLPAWVALAAAAVIELLGLATSAQALSLYEFNTSKRKTDQAAPLYLALALVAVYFLSTIALTVSLDIFPNLAQYAPALFPLLSLAGVGVLALRLDHRRRVESIAIEKAERRALRTAQTNAQDPAQAVAQNAQNTVLGSVNAAKQAKKAAQLETLVTVYSQNPHIGATEAAQVLGVHRNTIGNYTNELVESGRLHKNGQGWEVRS